ncbi:hypothetical protein [Syntrophothermus sp.]|nr:hypothetical protein [Syntrophothermus sp.]
MGNLRNTWLIRKRCRKKAVVICFTPDMVGEICREDGEDSAFPYQCGDVS